MKSNKGMTLVELIIAIAMLAMVITAIAGLMSSNTLTFKKQKSDVFVQNAAQETYNRLADAIMQAKEIKITGYTLSKEPEFNPTAMGYNNSDVTATEVSIKKGHVKDAKTESPGMFFQGYKVATATDADSMYKDVYITEMEIKYSVPLEMAGVPDALQSIIKNNSELYNKTENKVIPGATDTCTATYTFDENVMNVKLVYDAMTNYNTDTSDPDNLVYTKCLNFVYADGGTAVPGICAKIDAENGAIGLEMHFAQKTSENKKSDGSYPSTGMEYNSEGMINIRNSFVLMEQK